MAGEGGGIREKATQQYAQSARGGSRKAAVRKIRPNEVSTFITKKLVQVALYRKSGSRQGRVKRLLLERSPCQILLHTQWVFFFCILVPNASRAAGNKSHSRANVAKYDKQRKRLQSSTHTVDILPWLSHRRAWYTNIAFPQPMMANVEMVGSKYSISDTALISPPASVGRCNTSTAIGFASPRKSCAASIKLWSILECIMQIADHKGGSCTIPYQRSRLPLPVGNSRNSNKATVAATHGSQQDIDPHRKETNDHRTGSIIGLGSYPSNGYPSSRLQSRMVALSKRSRLNIVN